MTQKKHVVLAIVGLVIMVVVLVGSSYAALFNYENVPTADTNTENVFTIEGDQEVIINNKYPITYEEVAYNTNENLTIMNFTIAGHNNLKQGYNYSIYLVKGDNTEDIIDDSVIYAQISYSTITPGYSINDYGVNENKSFGRADNGAPLTGLNTGKEIKILDGNIHTLAEDAKQSFVIKLWLDSSKVVVSDTINRNENMISIDNDSSNGKLVYRTEEIQKLSNNIKLKIVNE